MLISGGYSIQRLLHLKGELIMFLTKQRSALVHFFAMMLGLLNCYLSDVFEKFNDLNISLLGKKLQQFCY